jgi:hypothetical protein
MGSAFWPRKSPSPRHNHIVEVTQAEEPWRNPKGHDPIESWWWRTKA